METTRRGTLGVLAAGAGLLAGCGKLARKAVGTPHPAVGAKDPEARLLHRTSFGPTEEELAALRELGRETYVRRLIRADVQEDLALTVALNRLDALRLDAESLREMPDPALLGQLSQAALLRACYGRNPLRERMTDFWSDHFNLDGRKRLIAIRLGSTIEPILRGGALGSFPAMLAAVTKSPAMLTYLDNQVNRKGTPNENLARELLELHSLGVDGGYSQKDVQEVARCLTGWTVEDRFLRPRGKFRFNAEAHDDGAKTVLGQKIAPGGGVSDGDRVLKIVSRHPATAHRIASKLTTAILGEPDPKWVGRLETVYQRTDGDVGSMLEPILIEADIARGPAILKRPYDFVASAVRHTGAIADGGRGMSEALDAMGQPLYQWPRPDGYPTTAQAWSGGMLSRWNFAYAFAHGELKGIEVPSADPDALAATLASPEFQWR